MAVVPYSSDVLAEPKLVVKSIHGSTLLTVRRRRCPHIFKRLIGESVYKGMHNPIDRLIIPRQFVLHIEQCLRNDIIVIQD